MSELRDRAIEAALAVLDDAPVMPFILMAGKDRPLQQVTVVAPRSDRALFSARKIVREHGAEMDDYAIVVDMYLRVDGAPHDALLIETGARDADAHVTAHRYRRGTGLIGEPIDFERRPSAFVELDPFALDWRGVTPDFYSGDRNHAVHVVGHVFDQTNTERTVRFLRARGRHFQRILPAGATQSVFVEDRPVPVGQDIREALARGLDGAMTVEYISELKRS